VALEFLQKIAERGHKVSVLTRRCGFREKANSQEGNINVYSAPSTDILSTFTKTPYPILKNISYYIKKINPDIVHANSHLFISSYQAVKTAYSIGMPSVVTVHGVMAQRGLMLNILQELYLYTMAKSIFNKASAVMCLTKNDATEIARIAGDNSNIFIVPNGVDIGFFEPTSVKDPDMITWVGRFVPEKGLTYLLKAMQRVIDKYKDVKLFLVGDGPLRAELMNLADKLRLRDNVNFVGSVCREEVARLLSKSEIFVFPSLKEGMPMALLEAMASGNAVVGSNIPGINDVMINNYNGMLVSSSNSDELASAILMLFSDKKLRERLAINARKTVEEKHSMDIVLNRLERVYNSIL